MAEPRARPGEHASERANPSENAGAN
jgi:hypothetical protein